MPHIVPFHRRAHVSLPGTGNAGPELHVLAGKLQILVLLRPNLGRLLNESLDRMLSDIDESEFQD